MPEQLASHSTCPAINPQLSPSVNHVNKKSFNQAVCLSVSQSRFENLILSLSIKQIITSNTQTR